MFECQQCHATTPDECSRRHEAQAALHRDLVLRRAAMHEAVDEIADWLIRYAESAASGNALGLAGADIDRHIAVSNLPGSAHHVYVDAAKIHALIASWSKR